MAAGGRRKRTDGSQGSGKNGQRGRCDLHWGVFAELVVGTAINAAISTRTGIEKCENAGAGPSSSERT